MNTDFIVWNDYIREKQFNKNITSKGDTRHYSDSCKTINKYAKEQNTIYDPMTNQILYGINSNMHVSGVSDGTCNQINPLISTPRYICGAGVAGANRCVANTDSKTNDIETFNYTTNSCNISEFVISLLLLFIFIGVLYVRNNKNIL